jgi:hypothetical protein
MHQPGAPVSDQKIEPALSVEEWADARDESGGVSESLAYEVCYLWGRARPAGTIAIANAALPNKDPRKITRAVVANVTFAARALDGAALVADPILRMEISATQLALRALADALQSYLPPEAQ